MTLSLRNCPFAFRCDRKWTSLKPTREPDIRFCGDCQREVHRCHTEGQLAEAVARNRCIAIQVEDFIGGPERVLMGVPLELPPEGY
ncbi:MAG: hypothetical protein K0Q68_1546 [Moraxellaceae bacterium]|jgi:hypothetical protein|nr:hypothetical protein [Moraxellaceae bacterium]